MRFGKVLDNSGCSEFSDCKHTRNCNKFRKLIEQVDKMNSIIYGLLDVLNYVPKFDGDEWFDCIVKVEKKG
tara:strand:+ start:1133 stop:1345 length:213 start_codon:yes stop_codon:yes gene_type:complete